MIGDIPRCRVEERPMTARQVRMAEVRRGMERWMPLAAILYAIVLLVEVALGHAFN